MTDATDTPPASPATTAVYVVGEALDRRMVFSRTSQSLWFDESVPCWLEGEDESKARPFTDIRDELDGKVLIDAEPHEHIVPPPGQVRDQIMRALGWDDETSAAMAEARHRARPDLYPTLESATYRDPEPTAPPAAEVPAVEPPAADTPGER